MAALACAACGQAPDWRQLAWAGGTELLIPCKPDRLERRLRLAGGDVPAQMLVCDAAGATWSATAFELPDAARQATALVELRDQLAANLAAGAEPPAGEPYRAPGLDAVPQGRRVQWQGHRPGGAATRADAAFAANGRWVYQLVVLTPAEQGRPGLSAQQQGAIDQFLGSLRRSPVAHPRVSVNAASGT